MVIKKRRTRAHIIADLSVNHVERHVLLCGHTVERVRADYGYDLLMVNYNVSGEIENGDVRLQIKATDAIRFSKDKASVAVKISRSDLILWVPERMPVILIVYDARLDIAYWLYVQRYFDLLGGFNPFAAEKTVTLYIPKSNVVDQGAIEEFSQFRVNILNQTGGVRHDR